MVILIVVLVSLLSFSSCTVISVDSIKLGKWGRKHVSQTEEQAMNPCITFHTFKF